jgi:hypothetical protein
MYTCLNPQLDSRDYNKMNTNGDGVDRDVGVGDGDDSHEGYMPWRKIIKGLFAYIISS